MKLRILHRTTYEYEGPISQSFNEARLRPVTDATQRCLEYQTVISPKAAVTREYGDFHGNQVQYFEIHESHAQLVVDSHAIVETLLTNPFDFTAAAWDRTMEADSSLHEYLIESHYVKLTPEIWRFAMDLAGNEQELWTLANGICQQIHKGFKYQPGSTHVHTSAGETLQQRTGVCQDFAHVMLGVFRSLKIPARYVSGYIFETGEMPVISGSGDTLASHAWCEIFLPGVGWRGLDATNGLIANDHYVKLAAGRDYADAAPLKGVYRGWPTKRMDVAVTIEAVQESCPQTLR